MLIYILKAEIVNDGRKGRAQVIEKGHRQTEKDHIQIFRHQEIGRAHV